MSAWMMRLCRAGWLAAALALDLAASGPARAAEACTPALAHVVSVQGAVEFQRAGGAWAPGRVNAALCSGDIVRVLPHSRAALLLSNQTVVRLDQGTVLTLSPPAGDRPSLLDQLRGSLHVITRTPRAFNVRTPFVNAHIEGTEFAVQVDADQALISVFEGVVRAANPAGDTRLGSGEQAVAGRDGAAPRKRLLLRPLDMVAWALHFPTVFDYPATAAGPLAPSQSLYRAGRVTEALAALEALPPRPPSADELVYRAALLLLVGRLDEARPVIEQARRLDPANTDALALLSLAALVANDPAGALALARQANAQGGAASPRALMALSYAQQAQPDLPSALASVRQALRLAPDYALAQARLAELEMSLGRLDAALAAAAEAVRLNPAVARTQSVLGFAHLLRIDSRAAAAAFQRAVDLDQADPLPRLGLGLVTIRSGDLAGGRAQLEIAASLDPGNAQVRSYLGKAYFEEKLDTLAAGQFALAKQFDPQDPTAYLYDAIRQQAANLPGAALADLLQSIALNERRAVYRSRLLLDQDRATRQVNLAALFGDLGAERQAVAIAADSVGDDPSNAAAHRFLSQAYGMRERHDIARSSELLQAQMLQPLSLNPIAAELPFTDLSLPLGAMQSTLFAHEPSSMFERDRVTAQAGLLAGNLGTQGGRLLLAALNGPVSASIGWFGYASEGFRPNADIHHRIWNGFVQWAATPALSLQAEVRERHSRQGDIVMNFDPEHYSPHNRADTDQRSARLGATWRPAPGRVWLASLVRSQARYGNRFSNDGDFDGSLNFDDRATLLELQYQGLLAHANVVAGGGRARIHSATRFSLSALGGQPCSQDCDNEDLARTGQANAYVYYRWQPGGPWAATLGLSRDHYDNGSVRIARWNPKFGLKYSAGPGLTLRAASVGTLKRELVTQQTLEPTQVMGFNQFRDDVVGAISRISTLAVDVQAGPGTAWGIEVGRQHSRVATGLLGPAFGPTPEQRLLTEWLRLDATARLASGLAATAGLSSERFQWPASLPTDAPTYLLTTRLPLTLRASHPSGAFGEIGVTGVWQRVRRLEGAGLPEGDSHFNVVDLGLGWRLPARLGTVSIHISNLLASKFSYQDDDFRSTEGRMAPYLPVRRVWLKASLAL